MQYANGAMGSRAYGNPRTWACVVLAWCMSYRVLAQTPGFGQVSEPGRVRPPDPSDTGCYADQIREAETLVRSDPERATTILLIARDRRHGCATSPPARFFEVLARARYEQDDLLDALANCDSALVHYQATGDRAGQCRIECLKGDCHTSAGDPLSASEHLESALTIAQEAEDGRSIAAVYQSLGRLHYYQRQLERAQEYYQEGVVIARAADDQLMLSKLFNGMALLAAEDESAPGMATLELAKIWCDSALASAKRVHDERQIASIHINTALVLMHAQQFARSRLHTDSALIIAETNGDSLNIVHAYENRGQMALRDNEPRSMCGYCEQMLDYGERHNMLRLKRDALRCLQDAYRLGGRWQEAYLTLLRYQSLRDSLYNASSRETILTRSLRAESERRSLADGRAHLTEMRRVRNEWLTIVGIAILMTMAGVFLLLLERKRRVDKAARTAAELEIKALRAQMNPHFLFNALNSINDHILDNDTEVASDYLVRFSRLMRHVLEMSRLNEVPLQREVEVIGLYVDLERMRLKERFTYTLTVAPEMDMMLVMVPPMILQPFVENAIWHGLSRKAGAGHLLIDVAIANGALRIAIEDDGAGRPDTMPTNEGHRSLGTTITKERLDLWAVQHTASAGYTYMNVPVGTRVEFTLPLVST